MMPPMMYQALTYRSESRALRNGRTNSKTIRMKARTTKASTTSGNSAHSSGWLKPAATSTHPGRTTAKFQIQNRNHPICQARDNVIKECQERIAQPSEKYALRVVVAKPAPGRPSVASQKLRKG